jgi:hypothetical protein
MEADCIADEKARRRVVRRSAALAKKWDGWSGTEGFSDLRYGVGGGELEGRASAVTDL